MREQFSSFYNDESQEYLKPIWESEKTLFVFDTNVLIDLYSFQPESRDNFFKVLGKIGDRIWIPYHVGLEFQRNRIDILKKRRMHYTQINEEIEKLNLALSFDAKKFTTLTNQFITKKSYPDLYEKIQSLSKKISEKTEVLRKELKSDLDVLKEEMTKYDRDKIFLNSVDHVRSKIDEYFNGEKIGECLFSNQEELDVFYLDGEERFLKKIPPGYADEESKGESEFDFNGLKYKRKFGDLIIFKEVIAVAKNRNIRNVIFVSGDKKSDWRIVERLDGDKILGARTEIKQEILMKANVENFYIFQIEEFLSKIKGYLDVDIDDDSLKDIIKSTKENWVNRLKRLNNSDSSLYSMQLENMHDSIYDFDEKFNNEEIYNQIIKNHFENSIKKNIMDDNKYLDFWYDLSLGRKIKEMAENYSSDFEENKIINSESKDNLIVDENYYKHKSIKEFMDKQSKLDKISKEKYQKMINNKNMKKNDSNE